MKRIHAGFPTQVMIPPVVWVAASAVCRARGTGIGCCGKDRIPAVDGGGGGGFGCGGLLEPATSAAGGVCGRGGGGFELGNVVLTAAAAALLLQAAFCMIAGDCGWSSVIVAVRATCRGCVAVAAAAAAVFVMAKSWGGAGSAGRVVRGIQVLPSPSNASRSIVEQVPAGSSCGGQVAGGSGTPSMRWRRCSKSGWPCSSALM